MVAAVADACIRLAAADVLEAGIDAAGGPFLLGDVRRSARGDLLEPGLPAIAVVLRRFRRRLPARGQHVFRRAGRRDGGMASTPADLRARTGTGRKVRNRACLFRNGGDSIARPSAIRLATICTPAVSSSISNRSPAIARFCKPAASRFCSNCAIMKWPIPLLANDTLAHLPPLTFFRGLVLELDGAQHDSFDIASAAITPIADAARVFAIAKRRLAPANTLERLAQAALDFPGGCDDLARSRGRLSHRALLSDAGRRLANRPGQAREIRSAAAQDCVLLDSAPARIHYFHFHSDRMIIETYLTAFENTWADDTPPQQVRFVVLDTETTGLDPRRDRMITIGAVAVRGGEILLDDSFEVMLKTGLQPLFRHRARHHARRGRSAAWTNRRRWRSFSIICATASSWATISATISRL